MPRQNPLRPLAGLLALGLAAPAAAAPSTQFPTYTTGLQPNGSYVVSDGQVISPFGKQIFLGIRVRAKAVAINPNVALHTAAVLTLGAAAPVLVFNTVTGQVMQNYLPFQDAQGSYGGITYSADGKHLIFSQDSSNVTIADVGPTGLLTDSAHISVPANTSQIACFPNSPLGVYDRPCGTLYTPGTSYPGGVAFSADGKSAYALLNQNDTLATLDLTKSPPVLGTQVRVGNAPHSIVLNGQFAYVSNEGGRAAVKSDVTVLSSGTPIVTYPANGAANNGTVSVYDTTKGTVVATVQVGLHPTGLAIYGNSLLVANTYSDTISFVSLQTNKVTKTIKLPVPLTVAGAPVYGAAPVSIAVDSTAKIAYVALYNANAVAVVDISGATTQPVLGYIPVAYAPGSVAFDATHKQLIVANDKGIGTLASFETDHGVTGYNTHQDTGTVTLVPIPTSTQLTALTKVVTQNNHWDLAANVASASGGSSSTKAVAIPAKIGDPSLIKHVFLIIRENRTYDQVLGDVPAGMGDAQLAVFGGKDTPNAHALIKRFPLLDNFYDPSRQSADGHQWITEAMAPYADDIQAPDWVRSYPGGNAGDSLAYLPKGFLFQESVQKGLRTKLYGEYSEQEFWKTSLGHPDWTTLYADAQAYEAGKEPTLKYQNAQTAMSSVPIVQLNLVKNFPMFDLNIPDQWRVDLWVQDFNKDVAAGTVPALSVLWIMDDHTGGNLNATTPLSSDAEQADNDLAIGRIIDYISHSNVWPTSAIFLEEDDAQNGVDHIDGHRSPGYIVSPYAVQNGPTDHTYYTQVNMTRTIEQILGLPTLNQFDLVASPMTTDFTNTPNLAPFTHVANQVPLATAAAAPRNALEKGWADKKRAMFQGKTSKADSEDSDTLNHLTWYEATHFSRPYPGESKIRPASDFKDRAAASADND